MRIKELLEYEIASSWWAPLVSWKWLQEIAAAYYANKAKRKYNKWMRYVLLKNII